MTVLAYDPVSPTAGGRPLRGPGGPRRPQRRDHPAPAAAGVHPHLIDAELLGSAKPGAILVNCGRGGLIDIDAVHAALLAGRLGGVGLDVFDPEPPGHHPLFDHPDVVLTPHLMGLSRRATAATFADAAQGVVDVLSGNAPAAVANPTGHGAPVRRWSRDEGPAVRQGGAGQRRHPGAGRGIARAAAREGPPGGRRTQRRAR